MPVAASDDDALIGLGEAMDEFAGGVAVDEGVVGEGGGHEDVSAVAAVSAGGATLGDELFAAEGHAAISTVAGLDSNSCFIDKHSASSL